MKHKLTGTAKSLRRSQTEAERKLWMKLRNRQLDGWKFKRQFAHGHYILDFFCFDANLVIEVDGSQHLDRTAEYDSVRTQQLQAQGLRVLRLWNTDVINNITGVLEGIYLALGQQQAPSPGAERQRRATEHTGAAPASPQGERLIGDDPHSPGGEDWIE